MFSPGVHASRSPPAQSGFAGSSSQELMSSHSTKTFGAGIRLGAGSGRLGSPLERNAFQNGVKTLYGPPFFVVTAQGSRSRQALKLRVSKPLRLSDVFISLSRLIAHGS